MKIVSLQAENVKRLRAVEIVPDPDGHTVVIAGRNGQGKTSVLDSIWFALGGGPATRDTTRPIRDGEDHASVTLDLGELLVTRTWSGDKTTLKVANADGARYGSPQAMLDGLVGHLSFDPLAFAQQDEKSQRTTLLSLVELPFDPADLAARRAGAFEQRTDVNRELKAMQARLAAMPKPPADLPAEEVSVADLLEKASQARQWQDRAQRIRDDHDAAQGRVRSAEEAVEAAQANLARERANLVEIGEALAKVPLELPDPLQYDEQLRSLDATNAAVRSASVRAELERAVTAHDQASQRLTDDIAAIDEQRTSALAEASMPIEGLGFDEDGVTYQDVPLKQASAAEQLRVSIAMAMALNPKLRVIRITDGSLLDSSNLALIEQMAADRDFQVWIERVDETGQVGILIEDGAVVAAGQPTAVSA
jgi:ABC-type dipeptide/oligopeptide/nickel transport system ATPase component